VRTPVTTNDADSASLISRRFATHGIVLWSGTSWTEHTTAKSSLTPSLSTLTVYDVFAYFDVATLGVRLEMSAGWTTATSRADAVARKDGVFVKSSDPTRRLVGTVLTDTHGNLPRHVRGSFLSGTPTTEWIGIWPSGS